MNFQCNHLPVLNFICSPLLAAGKHVFVKRLHTNSMLFTSILDNAIKAITNTPTINPTFLKKERPYAS
jgi:hypothetical protein